MGAEGVGKWHTVEQQCQGHVPSWPAANTGWPFNLLCGTPVVQVSSTVLELQRLLPRARFVYCSATGVSEVGCLQLVGLDWLRLSWQSVHCCYFGMNSTAVAR